MFAPKYTLLPQALRETMIARAREVGAYKASVEFATQANMNQQSLYEKLKKELEEGSHKFVEYKEVGKNLGKNGGKAPHSEERDLTKDEKEFLKKLETGEMTFEETSRFVAVRVFERMLKNPDKWQYLDFFRTELIKVKREEAQIKDAWAKEIIGRMFSGKLPPRNCPHCGKDVLEQKIIEGEVVSNGQKRLRPSF